MTRISQVVLAASILAPLAALAQPTAAPAPVPANVTLPPNVSMPPPNAPGPAGITYERPLQPLQENKIVRDDPAIDKLIAPNTKVEILAGPFNSTEGPMWRKGKLWVSDQRAIKIWAIDDKGNKTLISEDTGWKYDPAVTVNQGPNGEIPDKNGGALVMRQGFRDIGRLGADGKWTSFLSNWEGKRFNSPNDLVYAPDGTLFFTDPAYSLPGGTNGPNYDLKFEAVWSYKNGKLQPIIKDLLRPNGIGISPDGKTLYISTAAPGPRIVAYDIQKDGTVTNAHDFYVWPLAPGQRGGVDGLKVDTKGNLWATGMGGVNIITPQAKNLGHIEVAGHGTSNVAFGGKDYSDVFITGANFVYRVHTLTKGQKPLYAQ